jgi:hypothetical protein
MSNAMRGFKVARGVGAIMLFESAKPLIFPHVWRVGLVSCAVTLVLATVAAFQSSTASTEFGCTNCSTLPPPPPPPASDTTASDFALVMACGVLGAVWGTLSWLTCNGKKDDLNLSRVIALFEVQLARLASAEGRLREALRTMLVSDTKFEELEAQIRDSLAAVHHRLHEVRLHRTAHPVRSLHHCPPHSLFTARTSAARSPLRCSTPSTSTARASSPPTLTTASTTSPPTIYPPPMTRRWLPPLGAVCSRSRVGCAHAQKMTTRSSHCATPSSLPPPTWRWQP